MPSKGIKPKKTIARTAKKLDRLSSKIKNERKRTFLLTATGSSLMILGGVSATNVKYNFLSPVLAASGAYLTFSSKRISNKISVKANKQFGDLLKKIIEKPRLSKELTKKVKNPELIAIFDIALVAKNKKEKNALKSFIEGEMTIEEVKELSRLARKAYLKSKIIHTKKLQLSLRGQSNRLLKKLNSLIEVCSKKILSGEIKSRDELKNQISLPISKNLTIHTLDQFLITNPKYRKSIFESLRKYAHRLYQKKLFTKELNQLPHDQILQQAHSELLSNLRTAGIKPQQFIENYNAQFEQIINSLCLFIETKAALSSTQQKFLKVLQQN